MDSSIVLDELDELANEAFPGLIVRKDLLRRMRSAFGVPGFVIEFLLGKYCASTDEEEIEEGLEFVRETLSSKYVKPDELEAVKSAVKQHTTYEIIDKVTVKLVETHDKYWARLSNLNLDHISVDESAVRAHERLLLGGVWAEITMRYDDSYIFKGQNRPFFIDQIRPIQLSTRNIEGFLTARRHFSRDQWLDLLMRSMGYEPEHPYYTKRRKLHYMLRLIPLVERNFNSIELGPRGTGKSFVYQQISPYCHLVSGGQTTTAQMFVNLSSGQRGLVCLWDVVAFDEAAGVRFSDKSGVNILKGYMEDGAFSRGRDIISAEGSVVFVGNIDSKDLSLGANLFKPMPKEMDTAFFDRIHAYIPGWEFQKTSDDAYTDHFGLVTDYLAEVFRELRRRSYVDVAERHFSFGSHLGGRDQKAVRKIVSGLVKLLHPDGEVTKAETEEYLAYALEMRRRVKEQLKKMEAKEYWDTEFSYIDNDTGEETVVALRESVQGGFPGGEGGASANKGRKQEAKTPEPQVTRKVSAAELIAEGETAYVEFKSTLRVNLHTGQKDPRMEHSCLKTICAFLNSHGGTLLVGVDDHGQVLGLENDKFPNEDKLNLHLINLLKQRLGAEHSSRIIPRFESVDDKRVLLIRCTPSRVPVYLRDGKTEQFFVRIGAATAELKPSEIQGYIKQRF